ncbi:MAG: hypothetical protein KJ607_09620, partial [Bacteroidetes bacterium]|nr:hypothetical protein [Bacteroidota bacterium]
MSKIYVATDNMITSLGFSTGENLVQLRSGQTGIRIVNDTEISPDPVPLSPVDSIRLVEEFSRIGHSKDFTRYEQLHIVSVNDALKQTTLDPAGKDTLFIFSTTKGNIDLLEKKHVYRPDRRRLFLWESARIVTSYFGNPNKPMVVSSACISGVVAIII